MNVDEKLNLKMTSWFKLGSKIQPFVISSIIIISPTMEGADQ